MRLGREKNQPRKRKSVFAAVMINFKLSADEVVAYPEYRNIQRNYYGYYQLCRNVGSRSKVDIQKEAYKADDEYCYYI